MLNYFGSIIISDPAKKTTLTFTLFIIHKYKSNYV